MKENKRLVLSHSTCKVFMEESNLSKGDIHELRDLNNKKMVLEVRNNSKVWVKLADHNFNNTIKKAIDDYKMTGNVDVRIHSILL